MVTGRPRTTAQKGARPAPRPLDRTRLDELALAYVARFATSRARLVSYLRRKLRERGWAGDDEPPVEALADRMVESGYVDDRAYAASRTGGLLRRGYGERRIGQALQAAGIDEDTRGDLRPEGAELRRAALFMARKRRFGPFGSATPDRALREKQLAAMLRAGHRPAAARAVVDAKSIAAAEEWASATED